MNQEPKPTIELLLDECATLAKIATSGYKPYLSKATDGTYSAEANYSFHGYSTAVEALLALRDKLYQVAASKKGDVQNKLEELQQQLNILNQATDQLNVIH